MRSLVSILILTILFTLNSVATHAQDGYTPPPMFGGARVVEDDPAYKNSKTPEGRSEAPSQHVQPKPITQKKNKLFIPPAEKIDTVIQDRPVAAPVKAKPVKKKTVVEKPIPKPAPVKPKPKKVVIPAQLERVEPLSETLQWSELDVEETSPEAVQTIEVIEAELLPTKVIEKKKPTSQGIVKGTKTMPAIKKKNVESEVLFAPEATKPADLIDRAQKAEEIVERPVSNQIQQPKDFILPKFNIRADGGKKLNIGFSPTDKTVTDNQKYVVQELILPRLQEDKSLRLRLESYASPQNDSLSADRRISLSRVMGVREFLLDNGIDANRLDIRSLGAQTNTHPMDRVEIYILEP